MKLPAYRTAPHLEGNKAAIVYYLCNLGFKFLMMQMAMNSSSNTQGNSAVESFLIVATVC